MSRHAALSPSRVKDFKQCPLLFRFRVIDKIPEPPSVEALRGTLVHSVLELLFELPPRERTVQSAHHLLTKQWEEFARRDSSLTDLFQQKKDFNEWYNTAHLLLDAYFRMENPLFLEPTARESFVNARLPSGLAIRGIIDRIDKAPDGALRVVDYKTGKSPSPRFQEEALFQMRFYAAAICLSQGVLPRRTQLLYLKDERTLTYDPVPEDVDAIIFELDSVWERISERMASGNFEYRTSRLCDWCHFQDYCPAYRGTPPEINIAGLEALQTAKEQG